MLATLIPIAAQAIAGGVQAATSGAGARQREFEQFAKQNPLYQKSKSIQDYYQENLNRYRQSPFTTPEYLQGRKDIERGYASALSNLQGRGAAIGGATKLAENQAGSLSRLSTNLAGMKGQDLSRLGQAASALAQENYRAFDINQLTPFNRMLQIKQMKAQAAQERLNAGLQMIGGAASNAAYAGAAGAFKTTPKIPPVTSTDVPNLTSNITGSPYGKFNRFGAPFGQSKTTFGNKYLLSSLGGSLPNPLASMPSVSSEYDYENLPNY